jgi:glycosyltransferase involved in cell wall biosynthesis
MKSVAHLSTWDQTGGAAIAAWRLHEGMQGLGVESRMISRHRTWSGTDVSCIATEVHAAGDLFHKRRIKPAQPEGSKMFSVSPTSTCLLDHPWIAAADVVHLHWVALFVSPEDVQKLCQAGKTVFWTLHDQWAYTGGCHYIGGTRREGRDWDGSAQIDASLHPLVRMELERKKRCFASSSIRVIAPSRWMAREAAASGVFAAEQIHVVPYGLDSTVFRATDVGARTEETRGDPEAEVTLLFGCQNVEERRKGYQELCDAFLLCMADPRIGSAVENGRIHLKTFGRKPADGRDTPFPVTHLGLIRSEEDIAAILRDSSAFICPTLDDNLPNVVMESLACGCPVVGFATGGVPDMVDHGINGILAPQGDVPALAKCLADFCLDPALRLRLREGARATDLTNWTLEAQASRILQLYDAVSPCEASATPTAMPDAPPLVPLKAEIHAHFATEMTLALLAEQQAQKQEAEQLRGKLKAAENRIATLAQPHRTGTAAQGKPLQAKSGTGAARKKARPRPQPDRKRGFLQRFRQFLWKRWKRFTGSPS